jgi:hypothetical protein
MEGGEADLPDEFVPADFFYRDETPALFGHYGMRGLPHVLHPRPIVRVRGAFPDRVARLSVAERMAGIRKFGLHLANKGLAFHSKESVNVVIGGRRSRRRTLRPGDRADPGLASVRGRSWFGPSRDGGFEDVIQT